MKSKKELVEELNQTIQRTSTLTVLHTNAIADKIGLSATEFESMDIISRNQPISAGRLATECGLTTGAITGIIDRLERAGLVRRVNDPKDRRRVLLDPIDDFEKNKKICELYRPMSEMFNALAQECTSEQLRFLIDIHNKMIDMTEKSIAQLRQK
ncbi:MAG: putative transcriptional regulator, MarR family [Candidatus Saccharibacteria bacterium]|nr:putative transcriptional regulator, MarR family [Candidatus Saccharibacteria bacterium]